MAKGGEERIVRAAGCILWRPRLGPDCGDDDEHAPFEVLVIHRDRYDDWSFPKGKLEEGETELAAAIREVREETNMEGTLGVELPMVSYTDRKGRPKTVRYWPLEYQSGEFEPNDEVGVVEWLGVNAAIDRLSYTRDVELLAEFVRRLPGSTPASPDPSVRQR